MAFQSQETQICVHRKRTFWVFFNEANQNLAKRSIFAVAERINLGYLGTLYVHHATRQIFMLHRGREMAPLAKTLSYQTFPVQPSPIGVDRLPEVLPEEEILKITLVNVDLLLLWGNDKILKIYLAIMSNVALPLHLDIRSKWTPTAKSKGRERPFLKQRTNLNLFFILSTQNIIRGRKRHTRL